MKPLINTKENREAVTKVVTEFLLDQFPQPHFTASNPVRSEEMERHVNVTITVGDKVGTATLQWADYWGWAPWTLEPDNWLCEVLLDILPADEKEAGKMTDEIADTAMVLAFATFPKG
jgi:hypothetical protein